MSPLLPEKFVAGTDLLLRVRCVNASTDDALLGKPERLAECDHHRTQPVSVVVAVGTHSPRAQGLAPERSEREIVQVLVEYLVKTIDRQQRV